MRSIPLADPLIAVVTAQHGYTLPGLVGTVIGIDSGNVLIDFNAHDNENVSKDFPFWHWQTVVPLHNVMLFQFRDTNFGRKP